MGEKGEGSAATIIKDTWTITRQGWKQKREVRRAGGKGRKLYLNKNFKMFKKKILLYFLSVGKGRRKRGRET